MKKKDSYTELLKDSRWIKRRNEILTRDKNTCQFCGAQDRYLHVHHKKYFDGHFPWEYDDDALVTLCDDCHWYVHNNVDVDMAKVGDVFNFYHSDWCMTYIVYDVNSIDRIVRVLGVDDGGGSDSIYDDSYSFDYFKENCVKVLDENSFNYLFREWFAYILINLDKTPYAFRYNLNEIIENNPMLKEMSSNI